MKIITYLTSFIVFIAIALFALSSTSYFYNYQFERNGIYDIVDIPRSEMPKVIKAMGDYLVGARSDFQLEVMINGQETAVYNQREIDHMADVRKLFDLLKYCSIAVVFLIAYNFYRSAKNQRWQYLLKVANSAVIAINLFIACSLLLLFVDFTVAFTKFHEIFFSNDLWILNPKTDRLIQMLPEIFFQDAAVCIITCALLLALIFKIVCTYFKNKYSENSV